MKIKKNIGIMYAISFLQGMVFYSAVATLYRQQVGVTVFQITLIESISLALALALELPWGIVAERIGYKNTMIVCCVIYFISKIIFWQANGFGMFLLERILLAIVFAGMSGVDTSVLYLSCEEEYAQKAFGMYDSLGTAGMLLAAGIYTVFFHGQYRMTGFLTMLSYGAAMILSFFLEEVRAQAKGETDQKREFFLVLRDVFHRKEVLLFVIGVALFSECHQTITVFLSQLQYERAGMSEQMIGGAYILVTLSGLIGARSQALTQKLGKRRAGILLFGMAILACTILTITENPILSVVAVIALRIAFSLLMPLSQLIQNQQIRNQNRATALSINSLIMDGVAIGTNLVFGRAADHNIVYAFLIGIAFCVIGMGLFLFGLAVRSAKKDHEINR